MFSKRTADWYASCLSEPANAHAEWQDHGVAVLPLGASFEAVVSSDRRLVDIALARALEGPVIHDSRGRNYYALVEPGTSDRWSARSPVECLSRGTHLGVPDTTVDRPSEGRPIYWASPPAPGAYFCRTAAVQLLVPIGAARIAEAVQETHQAAASSGLEREVTTRG